MLAHAVREQTFRPSHSNMCDNFLILWHTYIIYTSLIRKKNMLEEEKETKAAYSASLQKIK